MLHMIKQIFLVVDESTLSGIKYLNILVGSLEIPHVDYLYDCQPLPCATNSKDIAQAVGDAIRSHESIETLPVFYCLTLGNI